MCIYTHRITTRVCATHSSSYCTRCLVTTLFLSIQERGKKIKKNKIPQTIDCRCTWYKETLCRPLRVASTTYIYSKIFTYIHIVIMQKGVVILPMVSPIHHQKSMSTIKLFFSKKKPSINIIYWFLCLPHAWKNKITMNILS